MDTLSIGPIRALARTYRLFLADFPRELKPEQLDVPPRERKAVLAGLRQLRKTIGGTYEWFERNAGPDDRWFDREYCYRTLEAPARMLLAFGAAGTVVCRGSGARLQASREALNRALKQCSVRDEPGAFRVLEQAGFERDGTSLTFHGQPGDGSLLRALVYYLSRLPSNPKTRRGTIFEVFLRADFRPLLPGYAVRLPHLPATANEVERTLTGSTRTVWRALMDFMADRHPDCQPRFRVPRMRSGGWVTDFSPEENDYGLWSLTADEAGVSVRVVMNAEGILDLQEHPAAVSPDFLESYLARVACKDCSHCGKHLTFLNAGRTHRLCKTPWYTSPPLRPDDLRDIERLVDLRIANA